MRAGHHPHADLLRGPPLTWSTWRLARSGAGSHDPHRGPVGHGGRRAGRRPGRGSSPSARRSRTAARRPARRRVSAPVAVPSTPVEMAAPPLGRARRPRSAARCRRSCPTTVRDLPAAPGDRPARSRTRPTASRRVTVACGVAAAADVRALDGGPGCVPLDTELLLMNRVCWYAERPPARAVWTTVDREVPVRVTVPRPYAAAGPVGERVLRHRGGDRRSRMTAGVPTGCGCKR